MEEKILKTKDVLKKLGISKMTLLRLEHEGKLVPFRRTSRSKYFYLSDVLSYMNIEATSEKPRKIIAYARVSSRKQQNELDHQVQYLETYATGRGIVVDEYIKDIGSGINYNNKGLNHLIDLITSNEVDEIIVSYKDRLVRFGFELIEHIAEKFSTKITVINLESTSPEEEIVDDLLTIITLFSNRIYGLRSYKTKIRKDTKK